jgi:hypothetical protein
MNNIFEPTKFGVLKYLEANPNLKGLQADIAAIFESTVNEICDFLTDESIDSAEMAAGFRKLIEAKDCLVRATYA